MNVFVIPSWYPTKSNPYTGIFFKEQAEAMAHIYPDSNFALSTWGSHDPDLLLSARDHVKNIVKILKPATRKPSQIQLNVNLTEYYSPAYTWTRKLLRGNIKNITKVSEKHLLAFEKKAGKVNVLHAHSAYPAGWVAMHLAAKYNIPYVITEHMGPFPFKSFHTRSGGISNYLVKPFRSSFSNIVVSPIQKATLERWGIPRVHHIPNLTDESFFTLKPNNQKQSGGYTFLTLARLEEGKGITYLLEAFRHLVKSQSGVRLRIGGDGSQQEHYKAYALKLGLENHVEWLGALDRNGVLKAYQSCDAFVLPSLHENLPLVLLEAIACGKPIISTYCGGPETIINEKNGLLVEPGDAKSLFGALENMYKNHPRYDEQEIREDFCSRYSRLVVCRQIMDVYQAAVASKI